MEKARGYFETKVDQEETPHDLDEKGLLPVVKVDKDDE